MYKVSKPNKTGCISTVLKLFIASCAFVSSGTVRVAPFFSINSAQAFEAVATTKELVAQRPDPNRDRLLPSGVESPTELPPPSETPPIEVPNPSTIPNNSDNQIYISVKRIEVIGNTVLSESDIAEITQPLIEQTVTLSQLNEAANAITQLYVARGYITSRALLTEQSIVDGLVTIQVNEGSLGDIQISGLSRLNERYVTSRLQRGLATPFNANKIEEQLRLLRFDPSVETIRGRLQPGESTDEPTLTVEVEESNSWRVGLGVDNYATPSTGSERMSTSVAYQNLSGWGDALSTSYTRSTTGGSSVWDIGYRLPVNPLDGSLSLRATFDNFELTSGRFSNGIDGSSDRYEVSFRQPIVRSLRQEFALSAGFSYRDGKTFIGQQTATDINRVDSVTSVVKLGQDYTRRDTRGVWGLRSQFSFGTGLLNATDNSDAADGQFFSWLGQVQRIQRLGQDNLLIIRLNRK